MLRLLQLLEDLAALELAMSRHQHIHVIVASLYEIVHRDVYPLRVEVATAVSGNKNGNPVSLFNRGKLTRKRYCCHR